jgi:hypothetical protein
MQRQSSSQSGFAHILLVIILVVAALAVVGVAIIVKV